MKVIATQPGWCGLAVRQAGEHFEIADRLFSPVWMVREDAPEVLSPVVEPIEKPRRFAKLMDFLQKDIRHIV